LRCRLQALNPHQALISRATSGSTEATRTHQPDPAPMSALPKR
jgi:hypothetical protein